MPVAVGGTGWDDTTVCIVLNLVIALDLVL